MLTRDLQQGFESKAKGLVDTYHANRESWLDFCLFPDIVEPKKMPSLFPLPTHIVRRQVVGQMQIPPGGSLWCMFKPVTVDPAGINSGFRSAFIRRETPPVANNSDNDGNNLQTHGSNNTVYGPSLTTGLGLTHGGVRLIGSFIEVEYMGTIEQTSGIIECGLHVHSVNSLIDMESVHYYEQSEMIQAPMYKKFKPQDGVRCVWFPIDDNDFNFQNYDIGTSEINEGATGATVRLSQHNFVEWAINLTGFQVGQQCRFHFCSYYETIPDEGVRDIYMATRGRQGAPANQYKMAINDAVAQGAVSTAAKTSGGFAGFYNEAKKYLSSLNSAYGLIKDVAPIVGNFVTGNYAGALSGAGGLVYNYAKEALS